MPHVNQIWRYQTGQPLLCDRDELAVEEPLEIRIANRAVSVTIRTPGTTKNWPPGFCLPKESCAAAAISSRRTLPARSHREYRQCHTGPHVNVDFSRLTRHVFASSSCGLCGKATIESIASASLRLTRR